MCTQYQTLTCDSDVAFKLLYFLQSIYAAPASVVPPKSSTDEGLTSIRNQISGREGQLKVLCSLGLHRNKQHTNAAKDYFLSKEHFNQFPNIIRVQNTKNANIFHFCPAIILNLLETNWENPNLGDSLKQSIVDRHPLVMNLNPGKEFTKHLFCSLQLMS